MGRLFCMYEYINIFICWNIQGAILECWLWFWWPVATHRWKIRRLPRKLQLLRHGPWTSFTSIKVLRLIVSLSNFSVEEIVSRQCIKCKSILEKNRFIAVREFVLNGLVRGRIEPIMTFWVISSLICWVLKLSIPHSYHHSSQVVWHRPSPCHDLPLCTYRRLLAELLELRWGLPFLHR